MTLHDIVEKIREKYVPSDLHKDQLDFMTQAKNKIVELEEKIVHLETMPQALSAELDAMRRRITMMEGNFNPGASSSATLPTIATTEEKPKA